MRKSIKIIFLVIISIFFMTSVSYGVNIEGLGSKGVNTQGNSVNITGTDSSSISNTIEGVGMNLLTKVKYIFSGILLIFLVYAGAQMIMSMGSDEDQLSKAKRTIWYSMVGLVFINMPGTLYEALRGDKTSVAGGIGNSWSNEITSTTSNLFINTDIFAITLNDYIIRFVQIILVSIAILVIIIAGLRIISSRGREEQITESKNKILWSVVGLIFIGFIEAWQQFAYGGEISDGSDIFEAIANLLLFLAGPVAIFFLTLAGFYYITANGDEDKVKKGKNIVINTIIATAILLISYIFLNDLITL